MANTLREHLEYLTLPGRTRLFETAIAQTIKPADKVADLGCGIGVLGLLCLEAGASEAWGIDRSDAIHMARETMERAGRAERYHCIHAETFQTELPERVDVLICDHAGFFGFDYGIIEMLEDARKRFLKPAGTIIPKSMELFVAAVSSDDCAELASAWSHDTIPSELRWLDVYQRNTRHPVDLTADDLISDPARLGRIEFDKANPELLSFTATLEIEKAGVFHGLAGWFDCALSTDVRMTNSPIDPASIKRRQAFLPAEKPFDVTLGDRIEISLKFRRDGSMITWTIQPPGGAAKQKLSTWSSRIVDPKDFVETPDAPLRLDKLGEARALILSLVDGARSADEISMIVLAEMPDLFPTRQAIAEFVSAVLRGNTHSS